MQFPTPRQTLNAFSTSMFSNASSNQLSKDKDMEFFKTKYPDALKEFKNVTKQIKTPMRATMYPLKKI